MASRDPERIHTAIRIPREIHEQLTRAADEREVSVNWLVNRALEDFLPRLVPVEEIQWTRPPGGDRG